MPTILNVALDVPLDRLFDYLDIALDNGRDNGQGAQIGQRVLVPFGQRKMVGIVVSTSESSEYPIEKLKPLISVFSQEPAIDPDTFQLLKFAAEYYQYPYGQALLSSLPNRLRQIAPAIARQTYAYRLTDTGRLVDLQTLPKRKLIQLKLMSALRADLQAHPDADHVGLDEAFLTTLSSAWKSAMQTLMEQGWVKKTALLAGFNTQVATEQPPPPLNAEQTKAVESVVECAEQFKPFLLHGITGSGKTEVYMAILQRLLADQDGERNRGQALVLVPEINLTPQLEARFRSRLPHFPLVSLHSNLSDSERLQNWRLAQSGTARIIIGTRLSVFTPIPHLSVILVDEEHDGSYKQQDSMRYHARDIAMVRAQRAKVPIVLGSATPALESWLNATTDRYQLLTLQQRAVAASGLPEIRCIDTTKVELKEGLSPALLHAIEQRLKKGEQSLLFINRRGYSPVLLCNACHWIAPCTRCSSRLVVHLKQGRLRCHHCGHEQKIVRQCPTCGNADLHPTGYGTQRLEETLKAHFPQANIQRVDRDSTRNKDALTDILSAVHAGEIDILVGTQMLAKGHDFPNLTLVGVIDTDSALFSPDFRASERLFAQLMQVAGRAGRAEKPGEVLIQTTFPDHQLFNALRSQDYPAYARILLAEREMTLFPPYAFMALIRVEAIQLAPVMQFLNDAMHYARQYSDEVMVYDPLRPSMEKLNGMERGHLLLQASQRLAIQKLLRQLTPALRAHPLSAKLRWAIDVDPLEF